ncbi:MAG: LCP family protein [Lachnospiraceae bacterium]|nr:LCP family protein [Lachnospiraceae bacterium]
MRKQKRYKRKKILFIVEIIVLLLLSFMLIVSLWAAHKFLLVNHQDLDKKRLFTADVSQADGIELIALAGLDTRAELQGKNSDTIIIACIDHNEKNIKLVSVYRDTYLNVGRDYYGNENYYTKANAAYNLGGAEQFLSMVNLNLDLHITQYISVDFSAMCMIVESLGGLDIDITREELIHINNYNLETAKTCNMTYEKIEIPPKNEFDGSMTRTFHLNGSQVVSYARIRYTVGNDFRRASRQRLVLSKIMEKAKGADLTVLNTMMNQVFPLVTTNLKSANIIFMFQKLFTYSMSEENQDGFPFAHMPDKKNITGSDCVIPVTLEYNVTRLHQFLFPNEAYTPSAVVQEYSQHIVRDSGLGEKDINKALEIDDGAKIPKWE